MTPALFLCLLLTPLKVAALHAELLDRRECGYTLTHLDRLPEDLALLRQRYRDLADVPYLVDRHRFPGPECCQQARDFNRLHRRHLECRLALELHHADELRAWIGENERLYEVWEALHEAQSEWYYVTVRRHGLARLRELLGPEAYYGGEMVPAVPVWRFQEVR